MAFRDEIGVGTVNRFIDALSVQNKPLAQNGQDEESDSPFFDEEECDTTLEPATSVYPSFPASITHTLDDGQLSMSFQLRSKTNSFWLDGLSSNLVRPA